MSAVAGQGGPEVVPVNTVLEPGITWRARMPRGVLDPRCPRGEPITTPTDRRMLWHLEGLIAVAATNDMLRQAATDLQAYLGETCEHHWHDYEGDDVIPAHRQCLWCDATEPGNGAASALQTACEQPRLSGDTQALPPGVSQVRLLPGQAGLIECPHCGVPVTSCPHGSYTDPEVLTAGAEQGWADPETDPAEIDWPARQAAAAIAFQVHHGRPVNPCEVTTVRYGRNQMGRWGENLMADALVSATCCGVRYLLMVERGDGYGWAVPGGAVEPGETGVQAAIRELAEETGLAVIEPGAACAAEPRYVADPRASAEAWAVTVPVTIDLGEVADLPAVTPADDATRAAWIPATSYSRLTTSLALGYDAQVFTAHAGMVQQHLDGGEIRHG